MRGVFQQPASLYALRRRAALIVSGEPVDQAGDDGARIHRRRTALEQDSGGGQAPESPPRLTVRQRLLAGGHSSLRATPFLHSARVPTPTSVSMVAN